MTSPSPRSSSTEYVAKGVLAALIVGFFIWEFIALPAAAHEALAVSLVGAVAVVICLQAAAFASIPDAFRSAASWRLR
jgi:hypothetical protein